MTPPEVAIVGIDPGPEPGVVVLWCSDGAVVHADTHADPWVTLRNLQWNSGMPELLVWVAIEQTIVGRGTARKTRAGSMETITQAEALRDAVRAHGLPLQFLPADRVKPIVTDARLRRFGVWGMLSTHHQRDAARHAVFMGVKYGALDDVADALREAFDNAE